MLPVDRALSIVLERAVLPPQQVGPGRRPRPRFLQERFAPTYDYPDFDKS